MNCTYCGCLLPDEYHPNCKQCGGPRKAARENRSLPPYTWADYPDDTGFLVPTEYRVPNRLYDMEGAVRQAAEQEDAAWMNLLKSGEAIGDEWEKW